MRAALVKEIGKPFIVEEVLVDRPRGNEVLIEVRGSGLCHSDLLLAENDYGQQVPFIPGHEVAGVVIEVGPDAERIRKDDHVVAAPVRACGRCDKCVQGQRTACRNANSFGRNTSHPPRITFDETDVAPGLSLCGFSEYTLIPENFLVAIDKDVPFDRAALLGCGVITGAGAVVRSARVQFGETVVVIGCGGVGLNALQAASLSGASKVIAVDLQESKLEIARKFGATHTVNPQNGDSVERVRAITDGRGVDHVFEIVGLERTLQDATQMLDHGGNVYVVGMQKPGSRMQVNVDPMDLHSLLRKEQSVKGVNMGSSNPLIDIPRYAEMYLQGRLNLDDLVSRTITLEAINDGYAEIKTGGIARSVVRF